MTYNISFNGTRYLVKNSKEVIVAKVDPKKNGKGKLVSVAATILQEGTRRGHRTDIEEFISAHFEQEGIKVYFS